MKIFAHIMGLLFCSAGHIPSQNLDKLPPPPLKWAQFSDTGLTKKVRKHKMFPQHCLLAYCFFFHEFPSGGGGQIYCLRTYQILQFCLFRKDSFDLTGSRYFWNFSRFSTIPCKLRWWTGICRFYAVFLPPAMADSKILLNFKKICLVTLKILKNLNSKQDSVAIEHHPGSRKSLNFPSYANSSPVPLAFFHQGGGGGEAEVPNLRQFAPLKTSVPTCNLVRKQKHNKTLRKNRFCPPPPTLKNIPRKKPECFE